MTFKLVIYSQRKTQAKGGRKDVNGIYKTKGMVMYTNIAWKAMIEAVVFGKKTIKIKEGKNSHEEND